MNHYRTLGVVLCLLQASWVGAVALDEAQLAFDNNDHKKAHELILPLAAAGDPEAQTKLGFLYMAGLSTPVDTDQAIKLFTVAAQRGYGRAQHALCIAHGQGVGVAMDYKAAIGWCEKSADGGNEVARTDLALFHLRGMGVKQDKIKARDMFLIAAGNGEPRAQRNLAIMLANGDAGYVDPIASRMWAGMAESSRASYCVQIEWCPKASPKGRAAKPSVETPAK